MYNKLTARFAAAILGAAFLVATVSPVALARGADLTAKHTFEIPAQKVATALLAFSDQAKIQVLMWAESKPDANSAGASGKLTSLDALNAILANTGLSFRQIDGGTIAIVYPETRVSAGVLEEIYLAQTATSVSSPPAAEGAPKDANEDKSGVQEIVVTAQKREENLQDVPISISVLGGAELDRSSRQGITEALLSVPGVGVSVGRQNGGTLLTVRGVGASQDVFGGSSAIGYYIDGMPFSLQRHAIAPDPSAYDLNRVEVLRGPQGTLYGASALNGVVRILTKDANPDAFELKARSSFSTTKAGGENFGGDVAVNVPIVEDKLAVRAVLGNYEYGGWIDAPNRRNVNDSRLRNARLKVNAQPTEKLSLGLSSWLSRNSAGAPAVSDQNMRTIALRDESAETDYDAYAATVGYDFLGFSASNVASYLEYSSLGFLDVFNNTFTSDFSADVFSDEITLASTREGPWRWTLGGIYRDAEDRVHTNFALFRADTDYSLFSKSFAAFGELTRLFLDGRVELTGGLRYFEDRVKFRENVAFDASLTRPLVQSSQTFDAISPRVILTAHLNEDLTLYASYSEGFRSGQMQSAPALVALPGLPTSDPDTLKNYEVGAKGSLLNGRLVFETALFYVDWQDVQLVVNVPIGNSNVFAGAFVNSESASGLGVDAAVKARPVDGLELGINFNWNDLTANGAVFSNGGLLVAEGDRLNNSPEYTAGASAAYAFPIGGSGYEGRLSASANYQSVFDTHLLTGIVSGDSLTTVRASFSIDAKQWSAVLFADNLTDTYPIVLPGPPAVRTRPRTIGVQLEYHF